MNHGAIIRERMERLGLTKPAETEAEYDGLFRRLQPVSTEYFTEPGQPPSLRYRALFDDIDYNRLLRRNQDVVKARFQGNTISYVLRDDLPVYASAFAKPLSRLDDTSIELLNVLEQVGPMDKKQLMEELDLKGPEVTKILQKFQKAFLIFELQPDTFGEQVWQSFRSEWPEFDKDSVPMEKARAIVIHRFVGNMVAADAVMVKDWTRFSSKAVKEILAGLVDDGRLAAAGEGQDAVFFLPEDKGVVMNRMLVQPEKTVHVLHKADYLYRAYESVLKDRYRGREVLQFILVDGVFKGAVEGHWRIGPHNVEDISLELPDDEADARKQEIMAAVSEIYHPPNNRIIRYNGSPI